jgi:hypothetical protein
MAILFYFKKDIKLWVASLIILVAIILGGYQVYSNYQKEQKDINFQTQTNYGIIDQSQKLDEVRGNLKDMEKKGSSTIADYLPYIVSELQNIRFRIDKGKNRSEYVNDYYKQIENIPKYYNRDEWLGSEKLIYEDTLNHIEGAFSSRGILNSSGTKLYIETFQNERSKLLRAKERTFKK